MSMTVARFLSEELPTARELPMPPWLFGVIALVAFAFLLGVTWSFRGTAQKYAPPSHGPAAQRAAAEAKRAEAAAGDRIAPMLNSLIVIAAEAEHGDPVLSPYVVGAIALGLLLLLLLALITFGGGREHS